jgi:hypothetical protein
MELMKRTTIKGDEVPFYMQALHDLSVIADSTDMVKAQVAFDASVDARDMPSGATKQPDQFKGD